MSLSPYYFTRLFKRIMMTSPHLYLLNHRLAEAKKMLVYTRDKIDTIAEATGFQSSSYFVRAFHREMNMTPKAFRQYFSAAGTHNRYKFEQEGGVLTDRCLTNRPYTRARNEHFSAGGDNDTRT